MKKIKFILILIIIYCNPESLFSQDQLRKWYFGNNEIDVSGVPQINALTNPLTLPNGIANI